METNGWLKVVVAQMQEDMKEIKADVKLLLEERAVSQGKMWTASLIFGLIGGVAGFVTELAVVWLQHT